MNWNSVSLAPTSCTLIVRPLCSFSLPFGVNTSASPLRTLMSAVPSG